MNRPDSKALLAFGACILGGLVLTLAPEPVLGASHALLLAPLLLLAGVLALVSSRRPPSGWDLAPAVAYLAFFAVLRDGTGGSGLSMAPMVVPAVLWVALFGSARQLVIVAVGCSAVVAAPLLLLDDGYVDADWRRALLWLLIISVMAAVIQRLVRSWGEHATSERQVSAQLDAVMDAAVGHAIITTDPEGRIRTFNHGAERMLGHRAVDVRGRRLDVVQDPFELEERLSARPGADFSSLVLNGAPDHEPTSWTFLRIDGTRVPVELTMSAIRDADGTVTGHVGIAIDVSGPLADRRRLENEERRWRVLLEKLPDTTVLLVDEDMRYREVASGSTTWRPLTERPAAEAGSLARTGVADHLRAVYNEALYGGSATTELRGEDGRTVSQLCAVPLPEHDGRREALVVVRDVTGDRERARALVAAQERAQRLFASSPFGGALLDLDGTILEANPMLEVVVGRSDLVGRPLGEVLDVAEQGAVDTHLATLLRSSDGRSTAQWATRTRAGTLYLSVTSVLLRTSDGDPDRVLLQCVDDSARHQHEQQLSFLVHHDALTGLVNRRAFVAALRAQVDLCHRYGLDGAVLRLDLDRFKGVNDEHGHAAGDALLVDLAELLRDRLRNTDVVARLGADEFAVLLPRADRSGALEVAEHIRLLVRSTLTTSDGSRPVSASIGVVMLDGDTADRLLQRADQALSAAKEAGRDCLALAPGLDVQALP